jgi:hypothetical protein
MVIGFFVFEEGPDFSGRNSELSLFFILGLQGFIERIDQRQAIAGKAGIIFVAAFLFERSECLSLEKNIFLKS